MYYKEKYEFDDFVDEYIDYKRAHCKLETQKNIIESSGVDINDFENFLRSYLDETDFLIFSKFSQGESLKKISLEVDQTYEALRKRYSKIKNNVKIAANIIGKNNKDI